MHIFRVFVDGRSSRHPTWRDAPSIMPASRANMDALTDTARRRRLAMVKALAPWQKPGHLELSVIPIETRSSCHLFYIIFSSGKEILVSRTIFGHKIFCRRSITFRCISLEWVIAIGTPGAISRRAKNMD